MLGSTANIFNVKAKNVLGGGDFWHSVGLQLAYKAVSQSFRAYKHWNGTTYTEILDWTQATNNSNHAKCKISYSGLDTRSITWDVSCHLRKAHRPFRAARCLHLQDLCSPRTVSWTLKMKHHWNAVPTDTLSYLGRLASLTPALTTRYYAVSYPDNI